MGLAVIAVPLLLSVLNGLAYRRQLPGAWWSYVAIPAGCAVAVAAGYVNYGLVTGNFWMPDGETIAIAQLLLKASVLMGLICWGITHGVLWLFRVRAVR